MVLTISGTDFILRYTVSIFRAKRIHLSSIEVQKFQKIGSKKIQKIDKIQVRSGMGAYAGAARRRVHRATVLPRPPSGHRPGRRQARILQIGLHLAQP